MFWRGAYRVNKVNKNKVIARPAGTISAKKSFQQAGRYSDGLMPPRSHHIQVTGRTAINPQKIELNEVLMDSLAVQRVALLRVATNGHRVDANNEQFIGADYRQHLESEREDEWVLLHEQQTWGACAMTPPAIATTNRRYMKWTRTLM